MDVFDDQILCRRLGAGDRSALGDLYDRHGALCYRAALATCGSSTMAEDAVQEVFIRLARDPAKPAAAVNLAAYVMRMAQHAAIDLLRTRQRHARQLALDPEQPAPPERGDRERDEQMSSALAELPIEQRTVVQLRIWEGLSMQDIATFLNLSPNTVSSRWRYALEKLSVLLKGLHDPL